MLIQLGLSELYETVVL